MAAIFAIMVPLLLIPIGAVVVDIGFWYRNAKHAQTTADAAVLAAAAEIDNDSAVTNFGGQYLTRNMPDVTTSIPDDVPGVGCPPIPSLSYCVEYPYIPDSGPHMGVPQVDEVEVTVRHPAPTFFGRIFGMFGTSQTRRAVAEQWKIPGTMAIYVNSEDCDAGESLEFDGENMHITGWMHSEGGLYIKAQGPPKPQPNFTASLGTHAFDFDGDVRCPHSINPYNQVADVQAPPGSGDYLPEGHEPIDWPTWYLADEFGFYSSPSETSPPINVGSQQPDQCRFKGEDITIENSVVKVSGGSFAGDYGYAGNVIPPGIYCATKSFQLVTSARRTGSITVVAAKITINPADNTLGYLADGTPAPLTAYADGGTPDAVLFFQVPNVTPTTADDGPPPDFNKSIHCKDFGGAPKYPTDELQFNGDGTRWDGLIFHPCGRVLVDQSNSRGNGSIVADRVKVNGQNFQFNGDSDFSAILEVGLLE